MNRTLDAFCDSLRFSNSYTRIPAFVKYAPFVPRDEWLRALGDNWCMCDNVSIYIAELAESPLFDCTPCVRREMMSASELESYNQLNQQIEIWRGCYWNNKSGLSWTLNRDTAEKFPFLMRYRQPGKPLLVLARVRKADVIALKLDRDEAEIITARPRIMSVRFLGGVS